MSQKSFKHSTMQDNESMAAYFTALQKGFESGCIVLSNGESQFEITPQGVIGLEIEVKRKDNKRKLHLKFSWTEHEEGVCENGGELTIGTR